MYSLVYRMHMHSYICIARVYIYSHHYICVIDILLIKRSVIINHEVVYPYYSTIVVLYTPTIAV